jgi:hypothetical protein
VSPSEGAKILEGGGVGVTVEELARRSDPLWMRFGVIVVNATVTAAVNIYYIHSTQQPLSAGLRFCVQLGLAVFRLVYAYCVLPLLPISRDEPLVNIVFQFRLTIVNNFIIPCVVTAFTSPSCFQVRPVARLYVLLYMLMLLSRISIL